MKQKWMSISSCFWVVAKIHRDLNPIEPNIDYSLLWYPVGKEHLHYIFRKFALYFQSCHQNCLPFQLYLTCKMTFTNTVAVFALAPWSVWPMFVERTVCYSALFTNLVWCHADAISFLPNGIIMAQLACPLSDVMFCLHSGRTNLSLYKHWVWQQIWMIPFLVEPPKEPR